MRTRKPVATRIDEILDAAQSLFLRKGYAAVQIEHIRQETGLSRGGFYHHFGSKTAVLRALTMREQTRLAKTAGRDLRSLISFGSTYATAQPGLESTLSEPDDIALYLTCLAEAQDKCLAPQLIAAIEAEGDGRISPEHAAELFLAVNHRINGQVLKGLWSHDKARSFSCSALRSLALLIGREGLFDAVLSDMEEPNG